MYRLSKISLVIFTLFYNYLWLRILFVYYLYNNNHFNGWMLAFILLVIVSIILIIIPSKIFNYNYIVTLNKTRFKLIYQLINIFEIAILVNYCSYLLSDKLIPNGNNFIIMFIFVVGIMFVGKLKSYEIINLSTNYYLLGIILIIFSLFLGVNFNKEIYDLFVLDINNSLSVIGVGLIVIMNNFKIIIDKNGLYFNKKNYVLGVVLGMTTSLIEYGILLIKSGHIMFSGIDNVGFLCLSFMPVTRYLGDLNFIYIYLIIVSLVFRCGFDISNLNKNKFYYLFGMLIIVICIFLNIIRNSLNILGCIILTFETIIYLILIVSEIIVRRIKNKS